MEKIKRTELILKLKLALGKGSAKKDIEGTIKFLTTWFQHKLKQAPMFGKIKSTELILKLKLAPWERVS